MTCARISGSARFLFFRLFFKGSSLCALALMCSTGTHPVAAQQEPEPGSPIATLRVETNLIQIPVLVLSRDRERIDRPIDASRFSVRLGNGPWMRPKFARREGDDPIDLALLIDTRYPQSDLLPKLGHAIAGLAGSSLNSRDRVSIYAMGCSAMHAVEEVPVNEERLRLAVDAVLRVEKDSGNSSCYSGNRLWDALAYVVRMLSTQPGRRTILAVTNGDDQKSRRTSEELAELAQTSGVSVFGLNPAFHVSSDLFLRSIDEKQLSNMTESSGGMTLDLDSQNVGKELKNFVQMLRDRYVVEFPRPDDVSAGKIDFAVRVMGPDLFVRTAGKSVPVANPKEGDRTVHLAETNEPVPPIEAPVSASQPEAPTAVPPIAAPVTASPVVAEVPARQLPAALEEALPPPPPATATLMVSTRLTVEDVTVADARRVPLHGLQRTDFELKEDGKVQTIKNFEENGTPGHASTATSTASSSAASLNVPAAATNILLLDEVTTGLSKGLAMAPDSWAYAQQKSLRYLKNLPAATTVAILQLGGSLRVLQPATSDKARLLAVVNGAAYQPVAESYAVQGNPGAACNAANVQSELVVNALEDLAHYLSAIKGRKNVIWFTPGTPWLTQYSEFSAVNCLRDYSAQLNKAYLLLSSARVALYPIDPRGLFTDPSQSVAAAPTRMGPVGPSGAMQPSLTPTQQAAAFGGKLQDDHYSLMVMAEATGGTPYYDRNDLDAALGEAIATGGHYYSLAYVPPLSGYDGKFHAISVRVDRPNAQLEYRRGYVSVDPAKVPSSSQAKH